MRRRVSLSRIAPGHIAMVLVGAAAFVLTYAALRDDTAYLDLAVAVSDLRRGAVVEPAMVGAVSIPTEGSEPPPGLLTLEAAELAISTGAFASGYVPAGAVIRQADLTDDNGVRPRAMSVAVDRSRAVDGSVAPDDLVDIVVTERGTARFALTGVRVLDVSDPAQAGGRTVVLTLEVDAAAGLRLAHAMSLGTLEIIRATGAPPADITAVYPETGTAGEGPADE